MEEYTRKSDKSIESICDAMIELLKEKDFNDISITEVCSKAKLARKTFYRNFQSKEEIIKKSIDRMFRKFSKTIDINKDIDPYELSLAYFEYWYIHKEYLTLLFKNNLFSIVNSQYDLYMKIFRRMMRGEDEEMSTELEYFIIFVSGGYWNILQHWTRKDFIDKPKDLAKMWSKHINKIKSDI